MWKVVVLVLVLFHGKTTPIDASYWIAKVFMLDRGVFKQ